MKQLSAQLVTDLTLWLAPPPGQGVSSSWPTCTLQLAEQLSLQKRQLNLEACIQMCVLRVPETQNV